MNKSFENTQKPLTRSVTEPTVVPISTGKMNMFSGKNLVIVILTVLLVLSFLGINMLTSLGNLLQVISNIFGPLIAQILSVFGYTAGAVIDTSTDIVTDVAKSGIDLAGDTIQSAAGLLKDASRGNVAHDAVRQLDDPFNRDKDTFKSRDNPGNQPKNPAKQTKNPPKNGKSSKIDSSINNSKRVTNNPVPDASINPIQKPITAGKVNWCLVGEYQGKRRCTAVTDESRCMSGQVFPTKHMCLNPTRTKFTRSKVR